MAFPVSYLKKFVDIERISHIRAYSAHGGVVIRAKAPVA